MRLTDLLRKATKLLEAAGIEDALADAELIVFHAVNRERLDAYVNNPEVTSADSARARRFLQRRLKGEPVQYIIGHIEFLGLTIKVGKGVLIPRPETEMLVAEAAITVMSNELSAVSQGKNSSLITRHPSLSILDLCAGSGCIALALAKEFPNAEVYGTDISNKALVYAKENAKANGIANVSFLQGSLFGPVKGREFDIIAANPPYIKKDEIPALQREVREWEPLSALDGGEDGMDFYRMILSSVSQFLKPGGFIFLELGYGQAKSVKKLAQKQGLKNIEIINDYAGIGRILKAKKRVIS